jgi:NADPH2:quinone reductase
MLKRLTITGSTLRARSVRFKAQIANQLLENVWPLLEKGHAQPVIYQSFPLSEA